jgi:hypothetical protein
MDQPTHFYKFVSYDRKDILQNGLIRFAPIGEFNDPFELEPHITPYAREFIELAQAMSAEERQSVRRTDEMLKFSMERENQVKHYSEKYRSEIKKYGVLSLTANFKRKALISVAMSTKHDPRTNLLLWAHYADSHRGFIIEFEADLIENIELKKVHYTNDRDYLTFEDIDENNFENVFYKKSPEWAYEEEYRAVLPLEKATAVAEINEKKFHLFQFNKASVRSIIFGCEMSESYREHIKEIIKLDPGYSNVTYMHARRDDSEYALNCDFDNGLGMTNRPTELSAVLAQIQFLKKHL